MRWRAALAALLLAPGAASAHHLPLWELGVGAAALRMPAYRGAPRPSTYLLPVPHLRYRGRRLRVDEEGIKGNMWRRPWALLDFSMGGNVPVRSDPRGPRAGMPDLDPVGEMGPSLELRLAQGAGGHRQLWFKLPVRAVVSVGDPLLAYRGIVASPHLNLSRYWWRRRARWEVNADLGAFWGDGRYHGYFYSVPSRYATAERPAYEAPGGYSGARVTLSLVVDHPRFWLGAMARYERLDGAAFVDSPLVARRDYFIVGLAFVWVVAHSEARAVHVE